MLGWIAVIFFMGRSWVALCYAGHGVVSAVAFWLAFGPPAAYVRWIAGSVRWKAQLSTLPPRSTPDTPDQVFARLGRSGS